MTGDSTIMQFVDLSSAYQEAGECSDIFFAFKLDNLPLLANTFYIDFQFKDATDTLQYSVALVFGNSTYSCKIMIWVNNGSGWTSGSWSSIMTKGNWYYCWIGRIEDYTAGNTRIWCNVTVDPSFQSALAGQYKDDTTNRSVTKLEIKIYYYTWSDGDSLKGLLGPMTYQNIDPTYYAIPNSIILDNFSLRKESEYGFLQLSEETDDWVVAKIFDQASVFFEAVESNEHEITDSQSYTPQTGHSASGNWKTDLNTLLSTVASDLDHAATWPKGNLRFPEPFRWLSTGLNWVNNSLIAPSFELSTDVVINGLKVIITNLTYLIVQIINLISDNADDFVQHFKGIFNVTTVNPESNYFDLGGYITKVLDVIEDVVPESFFDALKLKYSRIWFGGLLSSYSAYTFNMKIPTKFRLHIFDFTYDFDGFEILMPHLKWSNSLDLKVPFSEFFPYDPDVPAEWDRSDNDLGLGFTVSEIAKDLSMIVGFIGLLFVLGKFVPSDILAKAAVKLATNVNVVNPTLKDVVDIMGVPVDGSYQPTGNTLQDDISEVGVDVTEINDTTIPAVAANVATIAGQTANILSKVDDELVNALAVYTMRQQVVYMKNYTEAMHAYLMDPVSNPRPDPTDEELYTESEA
jgi:hypothetical protein